MTFTSNNSHIRQHSHHPPSSLSCHRSHQINCTDRDRSTILVSDTAVFLKTTSPAFSQATRFSLLRHQSSIHDSTPMVGHLSPPSFQCCRVNILRGSGNFTNTSGRLGLITATKQQLLSGQSHDRWRCLLSLRYEFLSKIILRWSPSSKQKFAGRSLL